MNYTEKECEVLAARLAEKVGMNCEPITWQLIISWHYGIKFDWKFFNKSGKIVVQPVFDGDDHFVAQIEYNDSNDWLVVSGDTALETVRLALIKLTGKSLHKETIGMVHQMNIPLRSVLLALELTSS